MRLSIFLLFVLFVTAAQAMAERELQTRLAKVRLPEGLQISVFTADTPGARSMSQSPKGTLYIGTRDQGKVYAVVDTNKDGKADKVLTVVSGLEQPNGVAFHDGSLYVAEIRRVIRFDQIEEWVQGRRKDPPSFKVVRADFPGEKHHGWKFIRFGPDGWLYIPVGAPCNICLSENKIFAALHRMSADGKKLETVAHGIRNTVGFDFHPRTKELWFTDNGGDNLGDDRPTDELNKLTTPGENFGYPYCHQGDFLDPQYGTGHRCSEFTPPFRKLGPHVAALGMRFYSGTALPEKYKGQIFIAEHGSWNRSKPLGYRISWVNTAASPPTYEVFAEGWLQNGQAWGRPVDVEVWADGSLLVSDDEAGAIYRISTKGR